MYQTYSFELRQKAMAYDGAKSLYTVGSLPQKSFELTVFLEESTYKR